MSKFTVRAIGQITDEYGTYVGAALEGDMTAVKALGRVYGNPVAIVPADLLDEAEKALANLADEMAHMLKLSPRKDGGLYRLRLDEARATLARIRGEKA